jgi:type I restriction enzyme S subunit
MNAERLLKHYERIADAPDAIARLRRFILDLAVRGKLVPQEPEDEPAGKLLKRIAAEKARLVEAEAIRKEKPIPPRPEPPFPLPSGWLWSQIAEIGVLSPRNEVSDTFDASFVPMPLIAAEYGVAHEYEVRPWGEIKKGYTHFAEGDVGLAKITPCFENGKSTVFRNLRGGIGSGTTELHVVRPLFIAPSYILIFLKSPHFIETGISKMTGTAGQKRVPAEYFAYSPFPLPPLAEQHRIVAKVDELMALCDRLEAERAEREAARDRLTAASLARLNAPDPDTFHADARFALDALPALTARPDQIRRIRQTILNLAVRGKLVPQDPGDEPATELLMQIRAEKARLVEAGELKKAEPTVNLITSDHDLPLPQGWVVTDLQSICVSITDGDHLPPPKAETGIPFLVIGNIRSQQINFAETRFVPQQYYYALDVTRRPRRGDLLYTLVGSYGIPVVVRDDQPFCVQRHIGILRPCRLIDVNFLARVMASRVVFEQATACATGIAQKTVPLSGLRRVMLPLPPLAEQHRIVAKVDALMTLCDKLETSLDAAAATRSRLLDALLAEALAPAEPVVLDMAG